MRQRADRRSADGADQDAGVERQAHRESMPEPDA
jgi:hypothetical protein